MHVQWHVDTDTGIVHGCLRAEAQIAAPRFRRKAGMHEHARWNTKTEGIFTVGQITCDGTCIERKAYAFWA